MSEWIDVRQDLPKPTACNESDAVLVAIYGGDIAVADYDYDVMRWISDEGFSFANGTVTHWMPLPAPPDSNGSGEGEVA